MVAGDLAVGPLAALVARADTLVGGAVLLWAALGVMFAFVATAVQRISLREIQRISGD